MPAKFLGAIWIVAAATTALLGSRRADAAVQEYQIMRLLSYHSECDVVALERPTPSSAPLSFHAKCANVALYPSGVDVACSDANDERSCRALTQPRRFDSLHLLQPEKH